MCHPCSSSPSHHPFTVDAAATHDAKAAALIQRPNPSTLAPMRLQSVSSHAATASAKSHSSAGHHQQSASDIAAAAGIVAAAAALQVIQSATEEVQAELEVPIVHQQLYISLCRITRLLPVSFAPCTLAWHAAAAGLDLLWACGCPGLAAAAADAAVAAAVAVAPNS